MTARWIGILNTFAGSNLAQNLQLYYIYIVETNNHKTKTAHLRFRGQISSESGRTCDCSGKSAFLNTFAGSKLAENLVLYYIDIVEFNKHKTKTAHFQFWSQTYVKTFKPLKLVRTICVNCALQGNSLASYIRKRTRKKFDMKNVHSLKKRISKSFKITLKFGGIL